MGPSAGRYRKIGLPQGRVIMSCHACGTQGPVNASFCFMCGAPLPDETPAVRLPDQDALAIGTALAVVTSGFPDPQDAPSGLAQLLDATRSPGMRVVQQEADRMLLVWGGPEPCADHAALAVSAALEMQAIAQGWQPETAEGAGQMRFGVHSGPCWIERRHSSVTVSGATLHHAYQLAQLARPGKVLISEPTCRLVREQVHTTPLPQVLDRSLDAQVAIYELGGRRLPTPPAWQAQASYVGRGPERERLADLAGQLRDGCGAVAGITGEAGLGKTRLISELKRSLADTPGGWLEARAQVWSQQRPNGLFADAIATLFDVNGEAPLVVQARLAQHLHDRDSQAPEPDGLPYARRVALLAHLFGVPLSEPDGVATVGSDTAAAIVQFLRQEARHRAGLVLVLDDLQWADDLSLDTLVTLLMSLDDVPLFVVLAYRTDVTLSQRLMNASPAYQEVVLAPLSADETRSLITARLPQVHLSPGAMAQVLVHTSGNPYYIEEVLKALVESGGLTVEDDVWVTTGRFSLPKTVRDAALGRLENLGPGQRAVLQVASVIGRSFTAQTLRDLMAVDWQDLALVELVRADLVVPIGDGRYIFRHNLTQEMAYATLDEADRQGWHAAVANWLEHHHGHQLHEIVELLAWHYVKAGTIGLPQALGYLLKAGERAMRQGAPATALQHWDHVLRLGDSALLPASARARVVSQMGELYLLTGQTDAAVAAYQEALALIGSAQQAVVHRKAAGTAEGVLNNVNNP
jgi:class 3 adenylate cyclase/tetratricopeptide (TPR) repeat protein